LPVRSYLRLVASQPRLLGFGFAMTFASSIGQTFFIGAFGPSIQQEFALSHGEWGGIYMAGTLLSAALLPWTGAQIDRLPLGRYTAMVVAAMVFAAAFMALVPAAGLLIVAIFCCVKPARAWRAIPAPRRRRAIPAPIAARRSP